MDNVFDKIFSILDNDDLNSHEEFNEIISNLTNKPAPLREACAYKLEDINLDKYIDEKTTDVILNAVVDINPNVSRSVCKTIQKSVKLQKMLYNKLVLAINDILSQISDNEKKSNNKSHAKNKMFFSLYWLLEALFVCIDRKCDNDIIKILHSAILFSDYTIREKAAKIISKLDNPPYELVEKLKSDTNFYVNFYTKLYKN